MSSNDYDYKRSSRGGIKYFEDMGCMGVFGYGDLIVESRSVLEDFTDNVLSIAAGNLLQNGTARTLNACE